MIDTASKEQRDPRLEDPKRTAVDAEGSASARVRSLLAIGQRDPQPYAEIIRSQPSAQSEVMELLQRALGNDVVQSIIQVLQPAKPVVPQDPVMQAQPAPNTLDVQAPDHAQPPPVAATHATAATKVGVRPYVGRQLDDADYLKNYQHLDGGGSLYDNPTTKHEADLLNGVRNDQRKVDPKYLLAWQSAVGVKNNSGAMNTDTLRKMVEKTSEADVTVANILNGSLFKKLAPDVAGKPIIDTGSGWGGSAAGTTGHVGPGQKADGMAQAAGFPNYAAMHHFTDLSLLGFSIGQGQPHLAKRVALADSWLSSRHPDAVGKEDVCQSKLNWSTKGNGAYSDKAELVEEFGFKGNLAVGPHMHSAGLALDIDGGVNPYVFNGDSNDKDEANGIMAKHLRQAAQIYGGEPITPQGLAAWSEQMSTEELWARVQEASKSLGLYLALAERGDDNEIFHAFHDPPPKGAGYPEKEARDAVIGVKRFGKKGWRDSVWQKDGGVKGRMFQDNTGRQNATGLMTHKMDMVVALRDVAGLAWGGTEMSPIENGDFMHFDLRHDGGPGTAVATFANHNTEAPKVDEKKP
jgi:hypothetical protein